MALDKVQVDDDVHHVDSRFLGIRDWFTFPFDVTYKGLIVGFFVGLIAYIVEHKILAVFGAPFPVVVMCVGGTIWGATWWIMSKVSFDMPVHCLAIVAWHEMTAPRLSQPVKVAVTIPKAARCIRR